MAFFGWDESKIVVTVFFGDFRFLIQPCQKRYMPLQQKKFGNRVLKMLSESLGLLAKFYIKTVGLYPK